MQVEIESRLGSCCNRLSYLPCNLTPLDIKGGVEAPPKEDKSKRYNHNTIVISNTRTHDIGLLSSRRPDPI
jgi:hypothetical protein